MSIMLLHAEKQKAGGIAATRLMNSYSSSCLELLGQTDVPVTVTNRVERGIVVVVKGADD
jgi:hypothetical protein